MYCPRDGAQLSFAFSLNNWFVLLVQSYHCFVVQRFREKELESDFSKANEN